MDSALVRLPAAAVLLVAGFLAAPALHSQPFDMAALKPAWEKRVAAVAARGRLPILDLESSYGPEQAERMLKDWAALMDKHGIALIVFAPQSLRPHRAPTLSDPARYIPAAPETNDAFAQNPLRCVEDQIARARRGGYPLLSEFYFRHYPSIRESRLEEAIRKDIDVPIDGEAGRRLFAFSEETGIPFQIHYDIEDRLLPALERALRAYPKAKVVWCHLAQVRFSKRAKRYGSAYVRSLIEQFPNIHFDLAFSEPDVIYPPSGERHARIWDPKTGHIAADWARLIADHPWRFHAALDIGPDRMDAFQERARRMRRVIDDLPPEIRPIVAYRASWRLLFNEDLVLGKAK